MYYSEKGSRGFSILQKEARKENKKLHAEWVNLLHTYNHCQRLITPNL